MLSSIVIHNLSKAARSYAREKHILITAEKEHLKSLENILIKIQSLISIVEGRGIEYHPNLKFWLYELREAAYKAEDVLDLFQYNDLRKKSTGVVPNVLSDAKLLLPFSNDHRLKQLQSAVKKFKNLADDSFESFLKLIEMHADIDKKNELIQRRQTTPVLAVKFYGRENEMEELQMLLCNTQNKERVSIVSIVGIGGVGKTTLMQCVYNCELISLNFHLKAWVHVSNPFDLKMVMMRIIESLSSSCNEAFDIQFYTLASATTVEMKLRSLLKKKRFLIVIDDVWDEKDETWTNLYSAFELGANGSKILITTRFQSVANSWKPTKLINLKGLLETDFQNLFNDCVGAINHPKLDIISANIAKKSEGLPLAAKSFGAILQSKEEEICWTEFLETKLWQYRLVIPCLKLSYDYLPAHLKPCFVYCSLFPKKYDFNKDKLVQYWMALNYIQPTEGKKSLEEIGLEYLSELTDRGFFLKVTDSIYVVHNLLHDLAEFISREEIYREEEEEDLIQSKLPKRWRHLFVKSTKWIQDLDKSCKKRVRSLVIMICQGFESNELKGLLKTFKRLRILIFIFQDISIEVSIPKDFFSEMAHIRYLELPDQTHVTLENHYLLQVIRVADNGKRTLYFDKLPKRNNLRYLSFSSERENFPRIAQLMVLQELRTFEVLDKSGNSITELENLNQLRGSLAITCLENVKDKEEAKRANLDKKKYINKLELCWTEQNITSEQNVTSEEKGKAEDVLEGLLPNAKLLCLTIKNYMGNCIPSWINDACLTNIELIELAKCSEVKSISSLEQLPYLRILRLDSLVVLEKITCINSTKFFPALEMLKLDNLPCLLEWSTPESDQVALMPRLTVVEIRHCLKLRTPIPFCSPLKKFEVDSMGDDVSLFNKYVPVTNNLSSLEVLSIGPDKAETYCNDEQRFSNLTSLKELTFKDCANLKYLPKAIKAMPTLKKLSIKNCEKLPFPIDDRPSQLKELHIS